MTHKERYILKADVLLEDVNSRVNAILEYLRKYYEQMVSFRVEGPYVTSDYLKQNKHGQIFERIEPNGSYSVGLPIVRVYMQVKQNIMEQHLQRLKPDENDKKIKEALSKLEKKLGVTIVSQIECLKELELNVMSSPRITS
jgi:hypothetical protein